MIGVNLEPSVARVCEVIEFGIDQREKGRPDLAAPSLYAFVIAVSGR
jgi:hypothetical protein